MFVRYVSEAVRWTTVSACVGTAAFFWTEWNGYLGGPATALLLTLAWQISGTRQRARDAAHAALSPSSDRTEPTAEA